MTHFSQKNQNNLDIKISPLSRLLSVVQEFVIIFLTILLIVVFLIMPFQIRWESMEWSFHDGEYILVNKFSYLNFPTHFADWKDENTIFPKKIIANIFEKIPLHIGDPERGDVVVIKPHINRMATYYLKRVIGLPGETIRIENGKVFIKKVGAENFVEIQENYLSERNKNNTNLPLNVTETEFTIPEWEYWVMGDNRTNSSDSRNCFWICESGEHSHFIPRKDIVGKIFMSLGHFSIIESIIPPKLGSFSLEVTPQFFTKNAWAEYPELE